LEILAIASDYDGTIAEDGVTAPSTLAALARFKASGRKLIMVTGRHLPDLKEVFGSLALFDVVVAENGGLLYYPHTGDVRPLAAAPSELFVARLRERGVDELAIGQAIVATHVRHHATIRDTIGEMALDLEIILNTDALMVLPQGINKASGLEAALVELSLPAASVAAIGDAENDVIFLKHCGYAVAVANALPEVKAVASVVTAAARGAGVEEFLGWVLGDAGRSPSGVSTVTSSASRQDPDCANA
jgi:HAD superfamily hydrolase (TIGR01484 family)